MLLFAPTARSRTNWHEDICVDVSSSGARSDLTCTRLLRGRKLSELMDVVGMLPKLAVVGDVKHTPTRPDLHFTSVANIASWLRVYSFAVFNHPALRRRKFAYSRRRHSVGRRVR